MSIDDGSLSSAGLLALHRRAQGLIDSALVKLPERALALPTPCSDWTLGELLSHVLGQNRGLASSARGGGQDLSDWRPHVLGPDPARDIAESAADVVAGFADRGSDRTVWMPEISPSAPIPARVALLAHLVDTVVHGWDIACLARSDLPGARRHPRCCGVRGGRSTRRGKPCSGRSRRPSPGIRSSCPTAGRRRSARQLARALGSQSALDATDQLKTYRADRPSEVGDFRGVDQLRRRE